MLISLRMRTVNERRPCRRVETRRSFELDEFFLRGRCVLDVHCTAGRAAGISVRVNEHYLSIMATVRVYHRVLTILSENVSVCHLSVCDHA